MMFQNKYIILYHYQQYVIDPIFLHPYQNLEVLFFFFQKFTSIKYTTIFSVTRSQSHFIFYSKCVGCLIYRKHKQLALNIFNCIFLCFVNWLHTFNKNIKYIIHKYITFQLLAKSIELPPSQINHSLNGIMNFTVYF